MEHVDGSTEVDIIKHILLRSTQRQDEEMNGEDQAERTGALSQKGIKRVHQDGIVMISNSLNKNKLRSR
jgi:hypothetical protein